MRIPCDTIARLSHVLSPADADVNEAFKCFRLDNGMIMASNRHYLVIEEIERFTGTYYIKASEALIEQCRTEAQFNSWIEITPVDALRYTTAVTTLGFSISENIGYWPAGATDFDAWRDRIMEPCRTPLEATSGHMTLHLPSMIELLKAAPSGTVTLEQHLDPRNRPTCVRDSDASNWVAFFRPSVTDGRSHAAAAVPGWCK
jgi:hypothetical protein